MHVCSCERPRKVERLPVAWCNVDPGPRRPLGKQIALNRYLWKPAVGETMAHLKQLAVTVTTIDPERDPAYQDAAQLKQIYEKAFWFASASGQVTAAQMTFDGGYRVAGFSRQP